jgi:hypothetical protein
LYRDKEDLYPILYKTIYEKIDSLKNYTFNFNYFCSTGLIFNHLDYDKVKLVEDVYFHPSDLVNSRVDILEKKYNIDYGNTIAILHRGTDKYKEAILAPLEEWIQQVKEKNKDNYRILLQTDDENFKKEFLKIFKNQTFTFDEMIVNNSYVFPETNKIEWCINFESIMRIISKCPIIITHSGNCGVIPIIYRASTTNVTQCYQDGKFLTF